MDSEALRGVMRVFPQGVVVVTAAAPGGEPRGITVSSFTSVSLTPPLVLICILKEAQAHEAIDEAGSFVVNILAEDQGALSDHFARTKLTSAEQFRTVSYRKQDGSAPLLDGCLGYLECKVVDRIAQADHTLFIGEVQSGNGAEDGKPLVFFSRQYWGLGKVAYQRD
jgi:flavin reductase (DIM6/NTAB) family NADH-FMN oxidoreductase RutF